MPSRPASAEPPPAAGLSSARHRRRPSRRPRKREPKERTRHGHACLPASVLTLAFPRRKNRRALPSPCTPLPLVAAEQNPSAPDGTGILVSKTSPCREARCEKGIAPRLLGNRRSKTILLQSTLARGTAATTPKFVHAPSPSSARPPPDDPINGQQQRSNPIHPPTHQWLALHIRSRGPGPCHTGRRTEGGVGDRGWVWGSGSPARRRFLVNRRPPQPFSAGKENEDLLPTARAVRSMGRRISSPDLLGWP